MSGRGKSRTHKGYPSWQSRMFQEYRNGAVRRGFTFDLTIDDMAMFAKKNCHYCGALPATRKFGPMCYAEANGIDRKDGSQGYNLENCVTSCATCNRMKMTMRGQQFIAHALRIAANVSR